MGFSGERGGIFPRPAETVGVSTRSTRLPRIDSQSDRLRVQALPQNHSSRDMGLQLRISPTNRPNHNHKR